MAATPQLNSKFIPDVSDSDEEGSTVILDNVQREFRDLWNAVDDIGKKQADLKRFLVLATTGLVGLTVLVSAISSAANVCHP